MSFVRGPGGDGGGGGLEPIARIAEAHEQEHRSSRSGRIATGTLACERCDAPVAIGPHPVMPTDTLTCPFCDHRAPVREFLSLAGPARPARVEVRIARTVQRPAG